MKLFQPHLLVQYLLSADFFHGAIMTLSLSIPRFLIELISEPYPA